MTRVRALAGALAGVLAAWLVAPHLFAEFASVRVKVVSDAIVATGDTLRVPVPAGAAFENLRDPFATISRIRNDSTRTLTIRIAVDDHEPCLAEISPGRSHRVDCAGRGAWRAGADHAVVFSGTAHGFAVEYFEVATHYGAITPGPRHIIVGPAGFSGSRSPSTWFLVAIGALVAASTWSLRAPHLLAPFSALHLAFTAMVFGLVVIIAASDRVSAYAALIDAWFLVKLLILTALPGLWGAVTAAARWLAHPRIRPAAQVVGVAILVGGIFLSLAAFRIEHRFAGHASGLLLVSHKYFDQHPTLAGRAEIRDSLFFNQGGGYDGQYFYMMTFDPFLTEFRASPATYKAFIDTPPYRYGRIGFSVLTKVLSGDDPRRYPVTMVAIVLVSLALCGALLAAIAARHGISPWYGALIAVVPGFWQSVETTLPEPLAVAGILAAYLCMLDRRWWICGALLAATMLVRETSGALVAAVIAGIWLQGARRPAIIVSLLAFVPIVLWKAFVAWVFWADYGAGGLMPAPDDAGVPLAGVWQMWTTIADGGYYPRFPALSRAGVVYPLLAGWAVILAVVAAVTRPGPIALAAATYAGLTVLYNYHGVWAHIGNAERLTIDLFVALAVVGLVIPADRRRLRRVFAGFWVATACYMLFATFEAASYREAVFGAPGS
jgi:hypothetical protein